MLERCCGGGFDSGISSFPLRASFPWHPAPRPMPLAALLSGLWFRLIPTVAKNGWDCYRLRGMDSDILSGVDGDSLSGMDSDIDSLRIMVDSDSLRGTNSESLRGMVDSGSLRGTNSDSLKDMVDSDSLIDMVDSDSLRSANSESLRGMVDSDSLRHTNSDCLRVTNSEGRSGLHTDGRLESDRVNDVGDSEEVHDDDEFDDT